MIAETELTHFIVTRFNLPLFDGRAAPDDDWLRTRLDLFRNYCLPGFTAQTCQLFEWIILFDAGSPEWFCDEITELSQGIFTPVYVDEPFDGLYLGRLIGKLLSTRYVVTTRVDNDDAIAIDFIETIHGQLEDGAPYFVNLVNGAQLAGSRVYRRPYTKNPFISLVERADTGPLLTVFVDEHFLLDQHADIHNVNTRHPMWMQVVHNDNVGNEIVGVRVPGRSIVARFRLPVPLDDHPVELVAEMMRDALKVLVRLVRKPARVRELFVAFASRAAVRRPQ